MKKGYVLAFNTVLDNLSIDYLVKQYGDNLSPAFSEIEKFTKQTLKKLMDYPNQLANAVDNANTYLDEHNKPNITFIHNDELTGLVYPNPSATYETANTILKIALINIVWSEYSAQIDNPYIIDEDEFIERVSIYPIDESGFIQRLDIELSGITNLIKLTN